MEVVLGVYADGTIIKADLATGQILKQEKTFQGKFDLTPSLVHLWSMEGTEYDPSSIILLQHKTSAKATGWACFQNHPIFIRTPASSFGASNRITSMATSQCGRWLFRGLHNGTLLATELVPSQGAKPLNEDHNSHHISMKNEDPLSNSNLTPERRWHHRLFPTPHLAAITCIATNHLGWIATASEDQTLHIAHIGQILGQGCDPNPSNLKPLENPIIPFTNGFQFQEHTLPITSIWLSNDTRVATISLDQSLKIYDLTSSTCITSITFPSALLCFTCSNIDHTFYIGAQDGTIYKCSLSGIQQSHTDWHSIIQTNTQKTTHDTHELYTHQSVSNWGNSNHSWVHQSSHQSTLNTYQGHTMAITSISTFYDGSRLATGSKDGYIIIWEESTCQIIHKIKPHQDTPIVWVRTMITPNQRNHQNKKEKTKNQINPVFKDRTYLEDIHSIPVVLKEQDGRGEQDKLNYKTIRNESIQGWLNTNFSQVECLKEEVKKLKEINQKWKEVNNSLLSSSLANINK